MKTFLLLALAALTAACGQEAAVVPVSQETRPAPPENRQVPQIQLEPGAYRVAGADDAEIDLPHAITLSVTADEISLASQCVAPRWTYSYQAGQLVTQRIVSEMCERTYYPAEIAAMAVFDRPRSIRRTAANGISIEGGGHSLLVFTQ